MNERWGGYYDRPFHYGGGRGAPPETENEKLARLKRWKQEAYESLQNAAKAFEDASDAYNKVYAASTAECTCCPKHGR